MKNERQQEMEDRRRAFRSIIERLQKGEEPEDVREEFKKAIGEVTVAEMAQIEGELIREGLSKEEAQRLCSVHLTLSKESLPEQKSLAPAGHPIHILMEEHRMILEFAEELKDTVQKMKNRKDFESADEELMQLARIAEHLKESESHYRREENVLFPYLEKHGVTQPPAIMWTEHDKIRKMKKDLYRILDTRKIEDLQRFVGEVDLAAAALARMLSSHFHKEDHILFPTAISVINHGEWIAVRREFDGLGYCCFTPEPSQMAAGEGKSAAPLAEGTISFETGTLSSEQLEFMLNTLPLDITFVDAEDVVRYFSQSGDRIFPRTNAVIGRKVQQCHPQKSLDKVERILKDFKSGTRDVAEFWINLKGRMIHIRYFAVRNKNREYLGCLEVTQDITEIQKITGEKRLD